MRLERTYHPLRLCYIAVQIAALASQHSLEFMMSAAPHLIAADFTLAGNVFPFGPTAAGPFSCEQRVEAAAKAGWDFGSPVTAMASMQYEPFTPAVWMLVPCTYSSIFG